jgi:hypothetical protein
VNQAPAAYASKAAASITPPPLDAGESAAQMARSAATGSAEALLSIGHVARFAEMSFAGEQRQISPYAYWWRDGRWTQLSQDGGPGGGTTIVVPGELSQVLEQLPGSAARRSRFPWRQR